MMLCPCLEPKYRNIFVVYICISLHFKHIYNILIFDNSSVLKIINTMGNCKTPFTGEQSRPPLQLTASLLLLTIYVGDGGSVVPHLATNYSILIGKETFL